MTTVATPVVVDLALFADYLASYRGICEPHPTDIPARACDFLDYGADFLGDGFAIAGMISIDAFALTVGLVVSSVALLAYSLLAHRA